MTGAPVAANAIRNGCPIFANGETTLSEEDVTDAVEVLEEEEEEEEELVLVILVVDLMLLLEEEDFVPGDSGKLTSVMSISWGKGGKFVSLLLSNVDVVAVDFCCIVVTVVAALLITVGL